MNRCDVNIDIINIDEAIERVLGHNDMYIRWMDSFFSDEIIMSIDKAFENCDIDEAHKAAHKLKGTAANLALTTLAAYARELDEHLKQNTPFSELQNLHEMLISAYNIAKEYYYEKRAYIKTYTL